MKKNKNHKKNTNHNRQLRTAAEKELKRSPIAVPEIRAKTHEEIVHELRVHQIELEMQNEELRNAQLALQTSIEKYIDLYDFAPLGYFTFTRDALIEEVNLTGASLLGVERRKLLNGRFRKFVSPAHLDTWDRHITNLFLLGDPQHCELELTREDGVKFYAMFQSVRIDLNSGISVVRTAMSDITVQKKVESEKEKLINELQAALAKIKTLSGLIPICATCKKIRDDKGYWNQLETYITKHSDALFSHGICPDCAKKAYAEFEEFKKMHRLQSEDRKDSEE